jgi:hypothetical protein
MALTHAELKDIVFRVAVIVLTFVISVTNDAVFSAFYMTASHPWYGLLFVTLFWELNRIGFLKAYKRLLPDATMGKRITVIFCISYTITAFLRLLYFYSVSWFFGDPSYPIETFIWNNILNCLMAVWPFIATYEMLFVNRIIRQIEQEKEDLVQANLQQQYDSLKEQVNPHFLFNNLNSLSALITKDPKRAEEFINQMSNVYRYLLRNNEENLTTLSEELKFIESYNHLLKTRFGDGFQPLIHVNETLKQYAVPPMTLQLLVENAVKHNIVSAEQPLRLTMLTENENLIVTNNLQTKTKTFESNGVGLANIIAKYKLLNQPALEIRKTKDHFTVVIPLIK